MTHTRALAGCHVRAVARGLQAASHRVGVGLSRAPVATSTWRWQRCSGGEQHSAPASASTIYANERETHSMRQSAHGCSNNPTGRAVGIESEVLLVFALTGMDGAYKELGK